LQYHGQLQLVPSRGNPVCPWLMVEPLELSSHPVNFTQWQLQTSVRHPADRKEDLLLFRRIRRM